MSKKAANSTYSKSLIPLVAKELGISAELCEDVINDYYDRAVKDIETMNKRSIFLRKLGTLTFSIKKIEKIIENNEDRILSKSSDGESFRKVIFTKEIYDKNNFLKDKLKKFKEEDEQLNKDLERKIQDFRRDKE